MEKFHRLFLLNDKKKFFSLPERGFLLKTQKSGRTHSQYLKQSHKSDTAYSFTLPSTTK